MLLLYAKYAFIFWLMIDSNQGDLMLMRELSEDETLLNVTACTKGCLQEAQQHQLVSFTQCFNYCKLNSTNDANRTLHKVQENFLLKLVCRTESKLTFRISWVQHSRQHNATEKLPQANAVAADLAPDVMFIIKVNAEIIEFMESQFYLSDENFFTIPDLDANTEYTITALAVHSNGAYSLITIDEEFSTLRAGYQPSKMGEVKLRGFQQQNDNWQGVAAEIQWMPSAERNCYFDMLAYSMHSSNMEMLTPIKFRDPRHLYHHIIPNLLFGEQYKVGVRIINDKNKLESPLQWITVEAPSCLDWFNNNYTLCAPLTPANLSVQQLHFEQNQLALNVSWSLPKYLPDFYTLHILDLHEDSDAAKFLVNRSASYYYINNITIKGVHFEVHLVAQTTGGRTEAVEFLDKAPLVPWLDDSLIKLILFLLAPICCIVVLCVVTLLRHNRQECEHLEAKELKETPNPSSDFHLSLINNSSLLATLAVEDNFELEDDLEVEPHSVLLQDILGEGAFGLVRRGLYKQQQVAVKLLKDQPNEEDIQAFKCEIQMLKAMDRHPNIVGIVGYSTRFSNRMMLLTEYCGLGSLQSFLRDEWKFRQECSLHELQPELVGQRSTEKQPKSSQKRLQQLIELDTRIEDINSSVLSTLEEENESDLSNQTDHYKQTKLILAADNKSYGLHPIENIDANQPTVECLKTILKQSQKDDRPAKASCTVSFENQEYFSQAATEKQEMSTRQPLKYVDLLDIAQQVAVGMDFLAQNKIVHRDLAARNVLISLDRTIKIADFGLSRDVYFENVYRKSGGSGKLPIKWLALESLTHQVYTSQSDVWSFGVLLYEIMTLGGMPYPAISPRDLLQLLRKGQRMRRPEGCTDEMFALMQSCWCSIPANRPPFGVLKQRLDAMIVATNELPERLRQQQQQQQQLLQLQQQQQQLNCLSNNEQSCNPHSQVEQLNCNVGPYLQPMN